MRVKELREFLRKGGFEKNTEALQSIFENYRKDGYRVVVNSRTRLAFMTFHKRDLQIKSTICVYYRNLGKARLGLILEMLKDLVNHAMSQDTLINKPKVKYRTIPLRIPEPDKRGACNILCPVRIGHEHVEGCKLGVVCTFDAEHVMYPGHGCPWYEKKLERE